MDPHDDRETVLAAIAFATWLTARDPSDILSRVALNAALADAEDLGIPGEEISRLMADARASARAA